MAAVFIGILQATRVLIQLKDLRRTKDEMGSYVKEFSLSVNNAQDCLKRLKGEIASNGSELEVLLHKAKPIRDELMFLTESAEAIAERLSVRASEAAKRQREEIAAEPAEEKPLQKLGLGSEQELLQLLKKIKRKAA